MKIGNIVKVKPISEIRRLTEEVYFLSGIRQQLTEEVYFLETEMSKFCDKYFRIEKDISKEYNASLKPYLS